MLLEVSPQPTHSMRHHKHFFTASQTSSCKCCNILQHWHIHPHVHGPYAVSSCTPFCHDSPLQSRSPVSGRAELWSISGQGSDVGYHQLYLLHQYSAVESKNKHRCHKKPAQHSNNKLPHQYISNNKFCTRYFYQPLYIYMHLHMYVCIYVCMYIYMHACMYVSKPMYFVRPKIQLKIQSFHFI